MDFDKMEKEVRENNLNAIRWALYDNGEITERELIKTYPASNCYSISKTFAATAVGILRDMGRLDLDAEFYGIKIRHLLTHTAGFAEGCLFESDRYSHGTNDFLRVALSKPIVNKPGEVFVYSNASTYILSRVVEEITGLRLDLFLRKHLFSKIGITQYAWECCPMGHTMGATGLYLPTRDLLRLGILYLNKGLWDGERVLSEEWVSEAASVQTPQNGGGFSFKIGGGYYSSSGAYSQYLCVIPERNIVFAQHAFEGKRYDELIGINERFLNL
jgi:CubicO group peptidase (beta-lactamase class C family)